jgi:hypothetical protein
MVLTGGGGKAAIFNALWKPNTRLAAMSRVFNCPKLPPILAYAPLTNTRSASTPLNGFERSGISGGS